MYGYVETGEHSALARRQISGIWFLAATVPYGGGLARLRRRYLLRQLRQKGAAQCILPPALTEEAGRYGLYPIDVQRLRLAMLPQLLDMRGDLRRETAVLRAPCVTPAVYDAAAVLTARVRYLSLEVNAGGEALARALRQRFGLCVGQVGHLPAVTVSFGGMPEENTICLGQDCQRWQSLDYALEGVPTEVTPPPEQLLAVLFEADRIKKEQIRVKTIAHIA